MNAPTPELTLETALSRAGEIADGVLAPAAGANDNAGRFSSEAIEALGQAGLLGLTLSPDHGGSGLGPRAFSLAAQAGDDTIAAEISKRLTALRSARSFVDWQQRRDFVKGLDLQRAMIVDQVAQTRADLALDLMWRFMDLAEPVLNRVDDSNGSVGDVFRAACQGLGTIAAKAKPDPVNLADRVFAAVQANDYGVWAEGRPGLD